jgi:iron complex outermembrane receptor protein
MNSRLLPRGGITIPQLAACGLGLSLVCATAVAQQQQTEPSHSTFQLKEIVVTAQYRRQNIQNVPIAITAFTPQTLQQQNITTLAQLGDLTPGVTLTSGAPFSGDSSVLSASIRGIGQADFAFNINPAVGVYVDGVYYARTIGANVNLLDVQNVSILKGPQGTLFGANTIGGAINITTRDPGETPYFVAEATGGSFNRRDVAFSADIPLIKHKLLSSVTFSSQNQDGYQRVIPYPASSPYSQTPFTVTPLSSFPEPGYGSSNTYGGTGVTAMRAKLLWLASDRLKMTLEGDWTHEDQTALPNVVLGTFSNSIAGATFSTLHNLCISNSAATLPGAIQAAGGPPTFVPANALFASVCAQPLAHVPGLSVGAPPPLGAGYVGGPPGPYNINNHPGTAYLGTNNPQIYITNAASQTGSYDTTYANAPNYARSDIFGLSLTGQYRINDNLTLKSISAYRQTSWNIGTNLDVTPADLFSVSDAQHQWQVSEEVQLLGTALHDKLNWVTGLYYFRESGYVHDFVPFENILQVYDGAANDVKNTDYAAYFHLDYRLSKKWGFIVGGRYTDAQTSFIGGQGDLNSFPFGSYCWLNSCNGAPPFTDIIPNAAAPGAPYYRYFPGTPDSQSWHIFDPTASIQYHFTPHVMGYVTWSKGFMAGGWTTRLSSLITNPKQARFGPEYSKAWDAGVKSDLLNHHLMLDADVFFTNFDGIQLNVQRGISPVLQNAGNANIKGAELAFESLVGRTGLELNGSVSYIDAYYTSVNPDAPIPEYADAQGNTYCPGGAAAGCTFTWAGVSALSAKLPDTPEWKAVLDPVYTLALPSGATLSFVPVYTYTGSMYNDSLNTPQMRRPVTHMVDASVHYTSPSGMYEFAVGGTNLTNDRFITTGQSNYGAGFIDGYVNAPREWYATIRVQMGH